MAPECAGVDTNRGGRGGQVSPFGTFRMERIWRACFPPVLAGDCQLDGARLRGDSTSMTPDLIKEEKTLLQERRTWAALWAVSLAMILAYSVAWAVQGNAIYAVPLGLLTCLLLRNAIYNFRRHHRAIKHYKPGVSGALPFNPYAPIRIYRPLRHMWSVIGWGSFQTVVFALFMWRAAVSAEGVSPPTIIAGALLVICISALAGALLEWVRFTFARWAPVYPSVAPTDQQAQGEDPSVQPDRVRFP
jgi:hypothetical protein